MAVGIGPYCTTLMCSLFTEPLKLHTLISKHTVIFLDLQHCIETHGANDDINESDNRFFFQNNTVTVIGVGETRKGKIYTE